MSYITNKGTVDSNNSTTSALSAGQVFTGTATDVSAYPSVVVAVKTDQSGTLNIQFSPDGTNWDSSLNYDITASVNEVHKITVTRKYFRIIITNTSGSSQTYLRAQTILGQQGNLVSFLNSTIQEDADATISRSVITGKTNGGTYKNVPITSEGHLEVAVHDPVLPFGSIHTEPLTPVFQTDAVYGINPNQVATTEFNGGSAFSLNNFFICKTNTTVGGSGTIQSRKRLRYRPGQGAVGRFTAIWDQPVANSILVAGLGTSESGFYMCLSGSTFGILQSIYGVREIRTLNVNTGSTATDNYNVTLDGTTYQVAATNNGSTLKTAQEIAGGSYLGWTTSLSGNNVIFLASQTGLKTGAFSLGQSGAGTPTSGTFTLNLSGKASEDTFIPQSEWNGDKLDGTGASGFTLDPHKGNLFEIGITYLGFGPITFKCMTISSDGNNPTWEVFHTIKNPNTLVRTNMSQPSFPFTMAAYSAGSTTNVGLSCASIAGFVEGEMRLIGPRETYERLATSVVGSTAGVYYPLFTVKNQVVYKNRANQSVVKLISLGAAHGDNTPMIVYLIKNATLQGTPNFSKHSEESCTYYDESATTCTISDKSQIILSLPIGASGNGVIYFQDDVTLQPGESVTLAARTVTGTSPYTIGSLNTREDQ